MLGLRQSRGYPYFIIASVGVVLLAGWFIINPRQQFGPSCYAFTIFNRLPLPLVDIQVRSDGTIRRVRKTHDLKLSDLQWLIEERPEVLIVSLGWSSVVEPRPEVLQLRGPNVHIVPNDSAIKLFNQLRKEGKRVAIQYHSTC